MWGSPFKVWILTARRSTLKHQKRDFTFSEQVISVKWTLPPVHGARDAKRQMGGRRGKKHPLMCFMNEFQDSIYTVTQ